ncbi:MAG: cupin domain-containing protein [Deltaproteobacteria bacterium]|nr:cupin domain-containing protein [Deltaproteobacteria bacterium]
MVLVKAAAQLPTFAAADGCQISEVVHPAGDHTSPGVSLARALVPPAGATQPHSLDFLEIYYIISGKGVMHAGEETAPLAPETCVYLPAGTVQWVENTSAQEPLIFLCVCHPGYDPAGDHPAT